MKCKECHWWKLIANDKNSQHNGAQRGRCRIRPPIATPVIMPVVNQIANTVTPQIVEVTVWPVTNADCEACGEFLKILHEPKTLKEKTNDG